MSLIIAKGNVLSSGAGGSFTVTISLLEGNDLQYGRYYVQQMGEGYYFDGLEEAVQAFVTLHEFAIKEYVRKKHD